jgi:segregation and condensation protein B
VSESSNGPPFPNDEDCGATAAELTAAELSATDGGHGDETGDELWLGDDLERLYRQAVDAMDAVEWPNVAPSAPSAGDDSTGDEVRAETLAPHDHPGDESPDPEPTDAGQDGSEPAGNPLPAANQAEPRTRAGSGETGEPSCGAEGGATRVTPRQIIEAALFVGGAPLTAKRLGSILGGEFDHEFVDRTIEDLNQLYGRQARPYEVRLGEGGYRLQLRPEFDRIRHRVYGLGPKEVKLSQEALELLALVAYKQPISPEEIEECGRPNAGGVLRQLLRRELIAIHRAEDDPKAVKYATTPRFLQLFGLTEIDELPRADELSLK